LALFFESAVIREDLKDGEKETKKNKNGTRFFKLAAAKQTKIKDQF